MRRFQSAWAAALFIDDFFRGQPVDEDGRETKEIVWQSLLIAVFCGKMWAPIPQSTEKMLTKCEAARRNFSDHHHAMTDFPPEIFCAAHGLVSLEPGIVAYVRNRTAMDIGAFNGDSALVFMDYVKEVYSFEPGPTNFRTLNHVIQANPGRFGVTKTFNIALSNFTGQAPFCDGPWSQAHFGKGDLGEVQVPVTTLDAFLKWRNVNVGFIKCDTEGHGLPILQGAEKTIKRHRPVLSFAVYHNFEEFFGIPRLLREIVPDYHFRWEFQTNWINKWHEMVFLAYPPEIVKYRVSHQRVASRYRNGTVLERKNVQRA
jgi:FkbM family methyltransferase